VLLGRPKNHPREKYAVPVQNKQPPEAHTVSPKTAVNPTNENAEVRMAHMSSFVVSALLLFVASSCLANNQSFQ
jgi:hypothetical protein